jgi:hypothetical protein
MPLRNIEGTDIQYYLISFDENGDERREADGSLLSETVRKRVAGKAEGITDVFLASHGWKGDVPAAIQQYDSWMGEMARSPDRAQMHLRNPAFKGISIGLHWPSLPFGDEDIPAADGRTLSAGTSSSNDDIDAQVAQYAATIADTPAARTAIRTILAADADDAGSQRELPADVSEAYRRLFAEAGLDARREDLGAAPGEDHPIFDAGMMYRAERTGESEQEGAAGGTLLGGGILDTVKGVLVAPLRQASFWKMKNRARIVGERGGHALLTSLMRATSERKTRFHLMGHSFGCIVVSASIAGEPGTPPLPRPVSSLFLVQGALSLWSFCPDIPFARGTSGYFNRILEKRLVSGPIVTTQSSLDRAVRILYPRAARARDQVTLGDDPPKFGGVGVFGAQGLGALAENRVIEPAPDHDYEFLKERVYNVDASMVIKTGGGFGGAHSDIAHPEVAHVMWQAVAAAP